MGNIAKWGTGDAVDCVTKVAMPILQSRLAAVQRYLPLAALHHEEDVEHVHQLRVWTRRADAATELYSEFLSQWRATWIRKQLGRMRKATNAARDDDVLLWRMEHGKEPVSGKLLKRVRAHRVAAQQDVLTVYKRMTKKKGRFDRIVAELLARVRLRGKRKRLPEPTYRDWARERFRPILDEFFARGVSSLDDTRELHQFRIAGKKLRYALELLAPAFGPELKSEAYPLVEDMQDVLGSVNDHASAVARLDRWLADNPDSKKTRQLREMREVEQTQLEDARRQFSTWWTDEKRLRMQETFDSMMGENG